MFANFNKEQLEKLYLGKEVHVIIWEGNTLFDGWGKVTEIDNQGNFKGTWCDKVVKSGQDYIALSD